MEYPVGIPKINKNNSRQTANPKGFKMNTSLEIMYLMVQKFCHGYRWCLIDRQAVFGSALNFAHLAVPLKSLIKDDHECHDAETMS